MYLLSLCVDSLYHNIYLSVHRTCDDKLIASGCSSSRPSSSRPVSCAVKKPHLDFVLRTFKSSVVQSFVKQEESVPFLQQPFHPVTASSVENDMNNDLLYGSHLNFPYTIAASPAISSHKSVLPVTMYICAFKHILSITLNTDTTSFSYSGNAVSDKRICIFPSFSFQLRLAQCHDPVYFTHIFTNSS